MFSAEGKADKDAKLAKLMDKRDAIMLVLKACSAKLDTLKSVGAPNFLQEVNEQRTIVQVNEFHSAIKAVFGDQRPIITNCKHFVIIRFEGQKDKKKSLDIGSKLVCNTGRLICLHANLLIFSVQTENS